MKSKNSIILFLFILIYGCTTDSNQNNSGAVVPATQTILTGIVVSTHQINLSWIDNSSNITSFKIARKSTIGDYVTIATLDANITNYSDMYLFPNTTYTYRVSRFNTTGIFPSFSNEQTFTTFSASLPVVTTTVPNVITSITASSGGIIVNDGGDTITANGVVWSSSPNPTIALSTKTANGTGTSNFTSLILGLTPNTRYYLRAYATNSVGTAYGTELNFITSSSSSSVCSDVTASYPTVTICSQIWLRKNLDVCTYTDGTAIPQVTDLNIFPLIKTGAWCYYDNDPANNEVYGKLYNWYAVAGIYDEASLNDPAFRKKLAPVGWHIPTQAEFESLICCVDTNCDLSFNNNISGGKLKETGTTNWQSPNTGADNNSGFTARPGGCLTGYVGNSGYTSNDFAFSGKGMGGEWWTISPGSAPYDFAIHTLFMKFDLDKAAIATEDKKTGRSVRCVKD